MFDYSQQITDVFLTTHKSMSWLIVGAKGLGKKDVVQRIAQNLLGKNGLSAGFKMLECALTDEAKKKIQKDILDGKAISIPHDADKKNEITVDDIRQGINFLSLKTTLACKILVISLAEEMNINAQNALLKTLEEPYEKTLIFLLSENPSKLLPTIISRCQKIILHPLSLDELQTQLKTEYPQNKDIELIAELSNGMIGVARDICQYNGLELYAQLQGFMQPVSQLDIDRVFSFVQEVSKDKNIWNLVVYFLLYHLHHQSLNCDVMLADRLVRLYDWIENLQQKTDSLYLDKTQVLSNMIFKIAETQK